MTRGLYRFDLQRSSAAELYAAVDEFTATKQPVEQRPREGYLLDFKQQWSDTALHTVAAFANTFGGLLIIGVTDIDGRPEKIIGEPWPGELKTRIGNIIASNLLPCPRSEIGECSLPSDPASKVCVVRVSETPEICLITKKGEQPVRVRVEDTSPPADAARLRDLLQRKRSKDVYHSQLNARREAWKSLFHVTVQNAQDPNNRVMSRSRLWSVIFPVAHPEIEIDINVESRFYSIVQKHFPFYGSDDERVENGPRSRDSFRTRRLILSHDFERAWQFDTSGTFGLVSQARWGDANNGPYWSLCDMIIDLALLLRSSRDFWQSFGYFGGAQLVVRMDIQGLKLLTDRHGFPPIFYQHYPPIARDALARSPNPITTNPLEEDLNVNAQTDDIYAISRLVNLLMRAQGHATDLTKLERSIGGVIPSSPK
jgi:hypothetical protein